MAAKAKAKSPPSKKGARKGAGKLKVAKAAAKSNRGGKAAAKPGAGKAPRAAKIVSTPDWAKSTRYIFRSGS